MKRNGWIERKNRQIKKLETSNPMLLMDRPMRNRKVEQNYKVNRPNN